MNLFKNEKREDEIRAIHPPTLGWLETKLSDKEMDYLWKCIDNRKETKKHQLAGQLHESNKLIDKSDWFWQHTLYPLCKKYYRQWSEPHV